jgi:ankyrin repeat protein
VLVIHAYQYLWVRLLMMRGCDTCAQDSDGYTAAHYAIERDDVEMLKALTLRFHSQAKPISEEQITNIHQLSLKALTLRDKQGLTPFMLACHHESVKCLNYLIEININDCNLEVNYFILFYFLNK